MKWLEYIASDVEFAYSNERVGFVKLLLVLFNPSLRACLLIRIAQFSPRWMFVIPRNLLVTLHGIDVGRGFWFGRRLSLPHPIGIVIGGGVRGGEECRIFQNVTLGQLNDGYPVLGNGVVVYPNSVIVGEVNLSDNTRVKACSLLFPAGVQRS